MSHWLSAGQLIDACNEAGFCLQAQAIEVAMELAAESLAAKLFIRADGVMEGEAAFNPRREGQECPDEILHCDEGSDWAEATREMES